MSFKSIVSAVMIFIQLIVMNVGYGLKESPHNETETPTEIVNDISSDEMSDSMLPIRSTAFRGILKRAKTTNT